MTSIALVGKPNAGKSLLFNRLTGMNQKVTNFPGITVQIRSGHKGDYTFHDFPGFYTFSALSQDEVIAVEQFDHFVSNKDLDKVLCVLDANQLEASLRIGLEIRHRAAMAGLPVIFAMNMIDEVPDSDRPDSKGLSLDLGCRVVNISAKTGEGLNTLLESLAEKLPPAPVDDRTFYEESLRLVKDYSGPVDDRRTSVSALDQFFLSPVTGLLSFIVIMTILFQSIFTFAVPFMDAIESAISFLGTQSATHLPDGVVKDFVVDALWGGLGSFLVFIPQIFFLTFIIGLLEDSGYLARAAMLCHRPLRYFGLSGKSFIPMLTGHACAIPAIYAARMIDSPRRRIITILILPLMGCSARLPVYAFLIAAVIPQTTYFGGLIGLQGLSLFAMYLFGLSVALLISWLISRSKYMSQQEVPFILELPNYRWPHWSLLFNRAFQSVWQFLSRAGKVIFTVTVIVWILGYFPSGELESSYLANMGHWIQPILSPLDLNWKYGVAILTSFLAREVFVGTLGTLFEIQNAEDNFSGLLENVQASGLSFASGAALLVFYAIALQCASTFAVMKTEVGNKAAIASLVAYTLLAYSCAYLVFVSINGLI